MDKLQKFITGTTRSWVILLQTLVSGYAVLFSTPLPPEWWVAYGGGLAWWWYDRSRLRKAANQGGGQNV